MRVLAVIFSILLVVTLSGASLNMVVFSFDRPMQLYAFLESFEKNVSGAEHIYVVYSSYSDEYRQAYEQVKRRFPYAEYLLQEHVADFKKLTLQAMALGSYDYIMFAVDDIVVTRLVNLDYCVKALETSKAYGYYLRLGKNISECYSENRTTGVPALKKVLPGVYSWQFKDGSGDWAYPHTVDMTLYRMKDVLSTLLKLPYRSPNVLEGNWAGIAPKNNHGGICSELSCIVNCPLNIVQMVFPNRHSNQVSVQELLEAFNGGLKIDIRPLQGIVNKAPHMDYVPVFIPRNDDTP